MGVRVAIVVVVGNSHRGGVYSKIYSFFMFCLASTSGAEDAVHEPASTYMHTIRLGMFFFRANVFTT